jgi:hypothetical protein
VSLRPTGTSRSVGARSPGRALGARCRRAVPRNRTSGRSLTLDATFSAFGSTFGPLDPVLTALTATRSTFSTSGTTFATSGTTLATSRSALATARAAFTTSGTTLAGAVAPRATTALRRVGDYNVRTLLGGGDKFDALVAWVERRSGLGRHHREDLDALHVLFDVSAIDVADNRPARNQRGTEHALGQFRACCAPRGHFTVQAGDLDLNATRHRVSNLVARPYGNISLGFKPLLETSE